MPAKLKIIISISAFAVFAAFLSITVFSAGPTCDPSGTCSVLTTDGSGNFGIGANSDAVSRLFIKDADTSATKYGLKIVSSDGSTPVFIVRNDGAVSLASSTYVGGRLCFGTMGTGTDCVTSWSGVGGGVTSTPAGYITPGYFNSVAGTGGNYSFPASLSIGTSTAPSGGVLFVNGNVGVGTASPDSYFTIYNSTETTGPDYLHVKAANASGAASLSLDRPSVSRYANLRFKTNGSLDWEIQTRGDVADTGSLVFRDGSGNNRLLINTSGNVGIGTTAPNLKLDIRGDTVIYSASGSYSEGLNIFRTGAGANGEGLNIHEGSAGTAMSASTLSGYLRLVPTTGHDDLVLGVYDGATDRKGILIKNSNAYVGIATTTPTYPLTVAGVIHSSTGGYRFPDGTTQTTAATGGGTNYFTLSSTNLYPTSTAYNVGIGTTTPSAKLDVDGDFKLSGSSRRIYGDWGNAATANRPTFQSNVANNGTYIQAIPNGAGSSAQFIATNSSDTTNFAYTAMAANASVSFLRSGVSGTGTQLPLVFQIGGSEKMRIDTVGNVGIATNAPEAKLHLVQDGTSYPPVYIDAYGTSAQIISRAAGGTLASPSATTNGQMMGGFAVRGRGTTAFSTGAKAGVLAYAAQAWTDSAQGTNILFYTTPNNTTTLTEGMRISDTGYVGIGTTNPLTKLHVAGGGMFATTDFAVGTTGSELLLGLGATTGNTYGSISVYNSGGGAYGNLALQPSGGNVGIGTTAPSYPLVISSTNANPIFLGITASSTVPISLAIGRTAAEGRFAVAHATGAFATDAAAGDLVIRTETTTSSIRMQAGAGATVLQITSSTVTVGGGTGKINVGTIDPPYTINGKQYATYISGMTGQKEETTGEISLSCLGGKCSAQIYFEKEEKGSDLWLFAKTTNLKNNLSKLTVLLTPSFDGKVWYEKDAKNNILKIFASPVISDKSLVDSYSVSYRFTAPRFDAIKWLNTRNEVGIDGFIIND